MVFKVKFNKLDEQMYGLCSWNAGLFETEMALTIQTDDLKAIKDIVSNLECFEIYNDETQIAQYTMFNGYKDITYLGQVFVANEGKFTDAMKITLTKVNIVEQIQKLDEQINPVINIDTMTIDEYKEYILNNISEACQEDIFAGMDITLPTGETEKFTYNMEDQTNLANAMSIVMQGADNPDLVVPYHANGKTCALYNVLSIATIYMTLQLMLTSKTTYTNMLNVYTRTLNTKEELSKCVYGMELPEEYQAKMNVIMSASNEIMSEIAKKYGIGEVTEGTEDTETVE